MKRKIIFIGILLLFFSFLGTSVWQSLNETHKLSKIEALRLKHEFFLRNSPFKEIIKLSKTERKARRLPPNKFYEREWELTMDPATGKPEPKRLFQLQEFLRQNRLFSKVPGENTNNWVERGPNNVGGRTRAIMFDPNDVTHKRVFAGGVSGGLWVNNDITNINSSWTEVGIPSNLAITCITYDPNNTNHFYLGTGESYVAGDAQGNGVWKSTDGGASWNRVFGGVSGETTFVTNAKLTVNAPAAIQGNYQVSTAEFGPLLPTAPGLTGNLVLVNDGSGSPTRGCNALTNGASINNNIAVVERGDCNFSVKVKNAQDQGAIAVLVVNNVSGPPITLGGTDATITIPSVMISRDEGQAIIALLGSGVNVTIQRVSAPTSGRYLTPGIHHINDIKIRDLGSTSEIYVAASSTFYAEGNPASIFGIQDFGLYKSTDGGSGWSKLGLPNAPGGSPYEPNDIEVSANNTIWVSTTTNIYGAGGGAILSSTNGATFSLKKTITNGARTQIAVSSQNAQTVYVLAEVSTPNPSTGDPYIAPYLYMSKTTDGFTSETNLALPDDADTNIDPDDFTRGQAFYDLMIEVDPTNDTKLYVGGIDLFRSNDSGTTWNQISKWSNNNNLSGLSVPLIHADQHAFVFHPTNANTVVLGNDGGVYYGTSMGTTPNISARNRNYNTVQFYHGAIGQEVANVKLLAGAQDNGSQFINNAVGGLNGSVEVTGGDGTYVFIDKDNGYIITSAQNGNYYYRDYATGTTSGYTIENSSLGGQFVNPAGLDSNSNYLFTDGSTSAFQINRYKLGTNSAVHDVISDPMFDGAATAFRISRFTSNTLFVGTDNGKLFKITNSTAKPNVTWQEITGADFYGSISCVELGTSENEIFVTFHNYGVPSVYYSSNGGVTWQNKEGNLPDFPVKAILMNPLKSNEVILGTELGVWGTANFNDASPNWSQAQNGMKDVKVMSFDLRTADNTVLAATHGRGMFTGQFTADNSTLSLQDVPSKKWINIYPTVSKGQFNVASERETGRGILRIFNISGKEVKTITLDFSKNRVQNISINVASGLYLAKFISGNIQSTHKIIIE